MQSTCGLSMTPTMRSVGFFSNEVWSDATTQSSCASVSSSTSSEPSARMFDLDPTQHLETREPAVQLVDLLPLRLEPCRRAGSASGR